ncbi:hypothetical protein ZWY2020_002472 [Hordeum vulgare]|nr:hypothetical protein ZWY2020_002472 [Hordeum vulgare]
MSMDSNTSLHGGGRSFREVTWDQHGEGLQVLHYEFGQKYEPHFDYFLDSFNTKNGGQRMATILMSDVEEGGETIFLDANVNSSSLPWYNELSECATKGLAVKPKFARKLHVVRFEALLICIYS